IRVAPVGQAIDERLKILRRAAEGRKLDRVRAWPGQQVLVRQSLLPINGRGTAEIIEVIQLAITGGGHAVGDRVLAVEPTGRPAWYHWLLREVIAGVAKVADGVVDPRLAVLPSRPALERDPHRRVDVGGIQLVTDEAHAVLVEQVGQGNRINGEARDALVEVVFRDRRFVVLAPSGRLLLAKLLGEGIDVLAA